MPASQSQTLPGRTIAVDRCDETAGADIAAALAGAGAHVRLCGEDEAALAALQRKMATQWLRADLAEQGSGGPDAVIRIFGTVPDAIDFVGSSASHGVAPEILVVSCEARQSDHAKLDEALRHQAGERRHAILLDQANDAFITLVGLLLSPLGAGIASQSFDLSGRETFTPSYPPMPVCMPASA